MNQQTSYLTFGLAGERYAVALSSLREIIGGVDVVPVPYAPADIRGIVNFRGQIVSILDLCRRFGLPATESKDETSTLVLQLKEQLIGLEVDHVESVIQVEDAQLEPPPTFSHHALLSLTESVARLERQFLVILSTEKIFSFEEMKRAEEERIPTSVS